MMYNLFMLNHLETETPLWDYLKTVNKPIVLYGTGNGADKIIDFASSLNIKIHGIFASDDFARGQHFRGYKVLNYNEIKKLLGEVIILQAFGTHRREVLENIKYLFKNNEYYVPDIEVCGNDFFTPKIYADMFGGYEKAYDLLEDELSKTIFDNLMLFKISGKPQYIFSNDEDVKENTNILKLFKNEVYVDVGAYDGDTVDNFINSVKNYKHIYAFEPDRYNFKKLYSKFKNNEKAELFNIAAGSQNGIIKFNQLKGRQSASDKNGNYTVACRKIDALSADATYIKIDAEGSELDVLKGAQNVIIKNKPKLKVAAYHRFADLLLPIFIKEIKPVYKVYLRKGAAIPPWDLDYYFI